MQTKFVRQIKEEKIELLRFEMLTQFNPETGSVVRVAFRILDNRGRITGESLTNDLRSIAEETYKSFRFKSGMDANTLKATFTMKPS
ncbi:MAG: hypothetical protein K8R69_00790 [Deltaproteobacteria bacterium]|nr:hypothetical protein [Deltaproteobacteria bacterium]